MALPDTLASLCREAPMARLVETLESIGSAVVAFSGGVDSTFLLRVARDVLGAKAQAVLGYSESLDRHEFEAAKLVAAELGVEVHVLETHEYDNPAYRRNDGSRCYHCKSELFTQLRRFADQAGVPHVIDGSHTGDRGEFRPGLRARDEQGVRSPLMEAGLDKEAIRRYSRALGLPTAEKPASPCLSSRIPYGDEVTAAKLRQVEAAEHALREIGFVTVRVRHHGNVARIEVPVEELRDVLAPERLPAVIAGMKAAGFVFVALDLEGFRSGSLNAARPGSAVDGIGGGAPGNGTLVRLDPPMRRPASGAVALGIERANSVPERLEGLVRD